jgi:hypothetical protein
LFVGLTRRVVVVAVAVMALVVAERFHQVPSVPTVPVSTPVGASDEPGRPEVSRPSEHHDVVVYGGSPAGVAAAIAAARHSADVTLVVAGSTVGGMMSNGISASDIGSPLAVQGVMLEFFEQVRAHYDDPRTWRFEPHVAERVLRGMLDETTVDVRFGSHLTSVRMAGPAVDCIVLSKGPDLCADTFVDASYTGDLVIGAGIPHRLGMSDFRSYDETLPGRRDWVEVTGVGPEGTAEARAAFAANPFVTTLDRVPAYSEAYAEGMPSLAYRLCVTDDADNRVPFGADIRYEEFLPSFRLIARELDGTVVQKSNGTLVSDIFQLAVIPGGKYDLNAGLARLTNLPAPAGYFDDPAVRAAHDRTLRAYVESFFHFLGTDPAVPAELRTTFAPFGLCADEFPDNGNWPLEPYVREGPRIEGRYTFTEADIYNRREKASAVALGSYDIDVKASRIVFADGRLVADADMLYTAPAYEIPFEVMLPEEGSAPNLLAPIALSASPTAYGSLRMEPQYVALGEAAGIAAALASRDGRVVASLPVSDVQAVLRYDGVLFTVQDLCRTTPAAWRATGGYDATTCRALPVQPSAV